MAQIVEQNSVIEITDGELLPEKRNIVILSAWRIAFFGAVFVLLLLLIFIPDPYRKILTYLPGGILITFQVTISAILLSLFLGLFIGLGRLSEIKVINIIATVYVEIIRGIPLLVQLFYIYYALAKFVKVPDMASAVIAMSICYAAYIGEIFRAGIQSIPKGQTEASLVLGMTKFQKMYRIIIPQAVKIVIPPIGNEFIALLKDSSLVSILAVSDLLRRGREYASLTFYYFEAYTMIALIYLVITLFLSKIVAIIEDRINQNGR